MRYLFYNPTGNDADDLRANLPGDVTAVPFGWTDEIEAARNDLLASLGLAGVSALPCLLFHVDAATVIDPETEEQTTIPAHWQEIRICDLDPPWTFEQIEAAEAARRAALSL